MNKIKRKPILLHHLDLNIQMGLENSIYSSHKAKKIKRYPILIQDISITPLSNFQMKIYNKIQSRENKEKVKNYLFYKKLKDKGNE